MLTPILHLAAGVSAGLGITMMPFSVVERQVKRGEVAIHRLAPADARVETVFIMRRDMIRSPALEEFILVISNQYMAVISAGARI